MGLLARNGLSEWHDLIDKGKIRKGTSKKNVNALMRLNEVFELNKRNLCLLHFLMNNVNKGRDSNFRSMFTSAESQKQFIIHAKYTVKTYLIDDEWHKPIENNIDSLFRRQEYIWLIIKENLRLTEYYPFFEDVGFEILYDFDMKAMNVSEQLKPILDMFEKWKKEHPDLIEKHMNSIASEKAAYENYKAEIQRQKKEEKQARKLAKKAENDEVREIKKNNQMHEARERRMKREFEKYYKLR